MRAAAQLDRPAERVAGAVAHRTTRTSSPYFSPNSARAPDDAAVVERHQARGDARILQHVVVRQILDLLQLLGRDRLGMREVEAQAVGRDQRALLRHVIAEHLAQRLVQQMRRRMVGADCRAARVIDLERERVPTFSVPCSTVPAVHEHVARPLLRVGDARATPSAVIAGIADLSAGLAVERRLVEHDLPLSPAFSSAISLPSRTSAVTTPSALSVS
jgi:hypothetical protein